MKSKASKKIKRKANTSVSHGTDPVQRMRSKASKKTKRKVSKKADGGKVFKKGPPRKKGAKRKKKTKRGVGIDAALAAMGE